MRLLVRHGCVLLGRYGQFLMDLNLREISYFLKVTELGSLGSAAAALAISQPALSRALKRLENRLGGELFVRHTLGVDLTAFGEAFVPHARILRADADRTIADLNLLKGAARGVARVGIVPSAASFVLPPVFERALRRAPEIEIHVVEAPSMQLAAELEHGNIDFAIASALPTQNTETITVSDLLREQMFVVARCSHPLAGGDPCTVDDLMRFPWIVPERGNAILLELRKMFMRGGVEPPRASVASNSVHTLKLTVASSDFLTMLPAMAFRHEEEQGLLAPVRIELPDMFRDLCVLRRAARPLLPAANLVLSEIRDLVTSGKGALQEPLVRPDKPLLTQPKERGPGVSYVNGLPHAGPR
ncbi:LysR family transcriptional regulator [Microbaculum marinisediminis]|uniref:LysR family transcriptional regulator n=1 Tax=Microbaculum marinisediminis TaxID=2931392 RepID=A0AAW5R674_9HYPH|nr:LysR family transcriptional regulator [Microbaculum sp. A6E488]MCT8974134.1 LysR family transcriptional regulator [Microbaculum sp. A6E488]